MNNTFPQAMSKWRVERVSEEYFFQEEREDFAILQVFTLEISAVYMH